VKQTDFESTDDERVRERPAADAPRPAAAAESGREPRVQLADPALAADAAVAADTRDRSAVDARSKKHALEAERVPDPREQMLRRQLDEFRVEHADRIKHPGGVEWVGSVVAAAVGSAIVHIGRQEYVDVALPPNATPPEVGSNVAIDRDGALTPVAAHHEIMREITPQERSL
jgi:hypothetical protein